MKLEELYEILKAATRHYPASADRLPCKQLQTFKVFGIDRMAELSTENAGATIYDKNSPYFYSRKWERMDYNPNEISFDFPVLGAVTLSADKVFRQNHTKGSYNIQLSVIDIKKDIADCQGYTHEQMQCAIRNVNEIYADCERMLDAVLLFLQNVVKVEFTSGANPDGWYYRPQLEGTRFIGNYEEKDDLSNYLNLNTQPARYDYVELNVNGHYGVTTTLRLENISCDFDKICVPVTATRSGAIGNESGCLTCG